MSSFRTLIVIIASIFFISIGGGALYETLVTVPHWAAAPPASLAMFQGEYGVNAAPFWMPKHTGATECMGIFLDLSSLKISRSAYHTVDLRLLLG